MQIMKNKKEENTSAPSLEISMMEIGSLSMGYPGVLSRALDIV